MAKLIIKKMKNDPKVNIKQHWKVNYKLYLKNS